MWKSCLYFQSQLQLQRVKNKLFAKCSISSDVLNQIRFENCLCFCSWFSGREMLKLLYNLSVLIKNPDLSAEGFLLLLIYLCYKDSVKHVLNVYCLFQ